MTTLRHLARSWHRLTLLFAIGALAVRLLVPAGYMPDIRHLGIVICTGHGPVTATIDLPHDQSVPSHPADKPDQPCGFGGAVGNALPPIDPVVFSAAIAVIVALAGISREVLLLRARAWLRPPLRGPPVLHLA